MIVTPWTCQNSFSLVASHNFFNLHTHENAFADSSAYHVTNTLKMSRFSTVKYCGASIAWRESKLATPNSQQLENPVLPSARNAQMQYGNRTHELRQFSASSNEPTAQDSQQLERFRKYECPRPVCLCRRTSSSPTRTADTAQTDTKSDVGASQEQQGSPCA